MTNIRTGFLILLIALAGTQTSAQLPDGVTSTRSFLNLIISNYTDENSFSFDQNAVSTHVKIPVSVHIVMNIEGSAGVSQGNILNSITLANTYFKNAGLQFFIDSTDIINDYNYSFITYNKLRKELLTKHAIPKRINLFLVDSVKTGTFRSYGFTYFPDEPDSNFIFLDKNYAGGNSLTTMLGHYMGLLSTHETAGGRELASEQNCSSAGDFICDTYADPDLFSQVDDSCRYTGSMRDDNGRYYVPSAANIMSDSPDICRCILTPLQYRRIYYYYHKYRHYLSN